MDLSRRQLLTRRPAAPPSPGEGAFWVHVARTAMACRFELTLPSELRAHLPRAHEALDQIDALEAQLSLFRDDSELSTLNRAAADVPVTIERGLLGLLRLCQELYVTTEGAFDVTSTPLSRVWGFLRREGRVPTEAQLADARALVGMHHVEIDAAAGAVRFDHPGVCLNLGSIGKGYALDVVARHLRGLTALLSAGSSSVLAIGRGVDGRGFEVGLRDPADHTRRLGTVRLQNAAVGVSGAGEQFFTQDGRRFGHLLDPRTGWPVEDRAYVAVVAPAARLADALATAFFVGGRPLAERYVKAHPLVSALIIDRTPDGNLAPPAIVGRPSLWRLTHAP